MAVSYFVRMRALDGQEDVVQELLLSNADRIRAGEPGNLAFGVHRSRDDPQEFWLYETWTDLAAVERHESGEAFTTYKERLRPLVAPDSVLFGNTTPLVTLGYAVPDDGDSLAQPFTRALGSGDETERSSSSSSATTSSPSPVAWGMDFARDTRDPGPILTGAGGVTESPSNESDQS